VGSLGETLRQARLDRGVSLLDAEQDTHIRRRYLEALENEDYGALPAVVYTRGFIRTYARYLGLDSEATLDLYAPGRVREERPALRSATPQLSAPQPVSLRLFTIAAGVLLALFLLSYLWTQYSQFAESLSQQEAGPRATGTAARTAPGASPSPAALALASPRTAAVASPNPAPERGIVLEVRITDRTWVEVWADGASVYQATMQTGTSRTFTANQSMKLRVGNAGGVQVTVNGEPKGTLGERNKVLDIEWQR
jgi:cytoskeletal protein RodZ